MKNFKTTRNQKGAALIVGLILLVVVTVLAVSGMNTATTELAMARNNQNYENAFQAAETGLEQAISRGIFSTTGTVTFAQDVNANDKVSSSINFEDATLVPDRAFSLGVGSGISAYHFLATSTSESKRAGVSAAATDRDASAIHTQSFYVVGPEQSPL